MFVFPAFQRDLDFKGKAENSNLTSCSLRYLPPFPLTTRSLLLALPVQPPRYFYGPLCVNPLIYCCSFPWGHAPHSLALMVEMLLKKEKHKLLTNKIFPNIILTAELC